MHPETSFDPPKSSFWTNALLVLVLLSLFGAIAIRILNPGRGVTATSHPGVGNQLSEVDFEPLVNTTTKVKLSDVVGKPALINIWGPWCGPCLQEFPELSALEKKHRVKNDVQFLLVSSDGGAGQSREELAADTQAVLRQNRSTAPIYYDPRGKVKSAIVTSARLDQFGYPTTIIIDKQGIIRAVWVGFNELAVEEMELVLQQLSRE